MIAEQIKSKLLEGAFIPAHPLAIFENKQLDEEAQRRLTRYYMAAGVDGIAVGVHTTQFEIREPQFNLYEKVLMLAMDEINKSGNDSFIKIAGVCGETIQAINEANLAKSLGYDLVLLGNNGLSHYSEDQLLERARQIANIIPVIGFYLQPAVGGRVFSYEFWAAFTEIKNVYAIKMAPFDRYLTIDVIRATLNSSRADEIALYTGNDDNIIQDLFSYFEAEVDGQIKSKQIVGGLLGHWAVWTKKSVELFDEIKEQRKSKMIEIQWNLCAQQVTDSNAAFFDSRNNFKGSIAGINEVLRRQGLLKGNWCLKEHEVLSEGQLEEINRVYEAYPHLHDDEFIRDFILEDAKEV